MIEQLKTIKDQLITQVWAQMSDLKNVNTEELGEVIDMIKDLAKSIYYCEIYEQMIKTDEYGYEENCYSYNEYEGHSPEKRKMYMESKMAGQDKAITIKELEEYMQELTSDMIELLDKASPEEKIMIQRKMNTLVAKVQNS